MKSTAVYRNYRADNLEQDDTSSAFPFRWPTSHGDDRPPEIVEFDEDRATEVIDALSSETARVLMSQLHDEPQTASDLAESGDTTVQNAKYHLDKFTEAGLVEVVDVWYSSRGAEMKVYGPTNRSLVLYTGESPNETPLGELLSQAVTAIGILGIASLVSDWIARTFAPAPKRTSNGATNIDLGTSINRTADGATGFPISPGFIFFLGGLFIILIVGIRWYCQTQPNRSA
jgi:DNA-binding transcriptional ArsR family regulator